MMMQGQAGSSVKIRVDEQIVRKMLKVNPALRAGRTTAQVKKSLERGEPLVASTTVALAASSPTDTASQLRDAVRFFLAGKREALASTRQSLGARHKALDEELETAKAAMRGQVVAFVRLLDRSALAAHGACVLAEHAALLRELGLDARVLTDARNTTR